MAAADKHFWMKFDMGDWLTDPALMLASPGARGFWMDLICHMGKARSAELVATPEQFALLGRCKASEAASFLHEICMRKIADVSDAEDGLKRVVCRRIARELGISEARKEAAKARWEENSADICKTDASTDANVHAKPMQNPDCDSDSSSCFPEGVQREVLAEAKLELVYAAYPRKVGRRAALTAIRAAVVRVAAGRDGPGMPVAEAMVYLHGRVQAFARSPAGQLGGFTPHAATWFSQERYYDDDQEWQRGRDGSDRQGGGRGPQRVEQAFDELRKAGVEVPAGRAEAGADEVRPAAWTGDGSDSAGVVLEGSR